MSEPVGGIIDDVHEALRWKPLMPLLKRAREATGTVEKLKATRDAAAFILRQLTGADPYTLRGFALFAMAVEYAESDPRVRAVIEQAILRPQ